jgi:GntR family transcriptional regulator
MARTTIPPPFLGQAPGTALHRQVFVVLRDEISRAVYASTGALPKEEALCERFSVSRITVRRALADLVAIGLVERRHGLGTFVRADLHLPRANPSLSFIDSLRQQATFTDVKVLEVKKVMPPANIAALLKLSPGELAVHAVRMRSIKGTPAMWTEAWVPADVGSKINVAALRKRALYLLLMDQGITFGRVVQDITTHLADPTIANLLKTEVGGSLIKLTRLMHDQDARPVQHLTALLPSDRSRIVMDIPGELINTLSAGQIVHELPGQPGYFL